MSSNIWNSDLGDGNYRNPILYADYSDPDAIRVGEDYFMIASSFSNAPGLPLLHSKDLVNWKVVNYIIHEISLRSAYTWMWGVGSRNQISQGDLLCMFSYAR